MISLLLATALAAHPSPAPAADVPLRIADAADVRALVAPRSTLRARALCAGAGRLQTGYAPTLLFREEDRKSARIRRLSEMPMADACLVESAR